VRHVFTNQMLPRGIGCHVPLFAFSCPVGKTALSETANQMLPRGNCQRILVRHGANGGGGIFKIRAEGMGGGGGGSGDS